MRPSSTSLRSDLAEFDLGPGDRVVQHSSAVYDSSVEESWLALSSGAALVVMDDDAVRLGPDLRAWLRRERVTVFCPTPTLLRATGCRDPERELPDLRLLYVGGEALPRDVAERWAKGRRLENGYGPTECTVTALRARINSGDEVSIGIPIPGASAWVLDESLQEVADGETGELCLGGVNLSRGYHRRPALTAQRFPEHPTLGRIYRTGDLAHRTADGVFHLHGRPRLAGKAARSPRGARGDRGAPCTLRWCAGGRVSLAGGRRDAGPRRVRGAGEPRRAAR